MRTLAYLTLVACGGGGFSGTGTPEQVIDGASDGQQVDVTGDVFAVTYESTPVAARFVDLGDVMLQDDEELRGQVHAFDDTNARYPRTTDRYILIRTVVPPGVAIDDPAFSPNNLAAAWGLGIHLPDLAPGEAMPEIGATVHVTGTFRRVTWNQREIQLPIVDDAVIDSSGGPPDLAAMGASCTLDQACSARLVCDRATSTCQVPPREIYWADPFHDVNGACSTDTDCPLGQVCDLASTIGGTGEFGAHYFVSVDVGRHLCRLAPAAATVAAQCPRIYTTRDLVGGRFVTGKEVCVRATLFVGVHAEDNDTHDQMRVDEPIPYPTADGQYQSFGATTENAPMYKDPALPGGPVLDPIEGQEVIAIGTYRYDPDHGWYEVHPVKAYLAP